jgi:hypothetical protein
VATYNDIVTSKHATLVGATVDTINFRGSVSEVEIINLDSALEIFATVDGTTPVVDGDNTIMVRPGDAVPVTGGGSVVKLISSGAAEYHVERIR